MPQQPKDQASDQNRLPFEPSQNKKKTEKKSPGQSAPKRADTKREGSSKRKQDRDANSIPEAVSNRMVKRMGFFCGIPTLLGIMTFFVSYLIVTSELFEIPPTAVLFVSLGFFGLGVVGLSYGALSTSWDESSPGSLIGLDEFKINLGRMQQAWREARNQSRST
ncbi:MAG: PAM68 family protein [Leptolyngbyaceae bacterium]|nr:PAM68 family protein [Leptolyngbyaceae bacterium]